MSNATVKPEPKERMSEKKIIQTAENLDAMINAYDGSPGDGATRAQNS